MVIFALKLAESRFGVHHHSPGSGGEYLVELSKGERQVSVALSAGSGRTAMDLLDLAVLWCALELTIVVLGGSN